MKRSPIKRRTPLTSAGKLARAAGPKRKKAMRRTNAKRRRAAYQRNFGSRSDVVRSMPCLVPGCPGQSVAAHAIARGMGGCKGDRRHLVPLCDAHHREAGEHRTSQRADFERRHGVDLVAEAAWLAVELDRRGLP